MAPTDETVGLTLRELVLEVRADVKDLKEDLVPRVALLEQDGVKTKAVAAALVADKKRRSYRTNAAWAVFITGLTLAVNAIYPVVLR